MYIVWLSNLMLMLVDLILANNFRFFISTQVIFAKIGLRFPNDSQKMIGDKKTRNLSCSQMSMFVENEMVWDQ